MLPPPGAITSPSLCITPKHANTAPAHAGNADGLGETRKEELVKSGLLLGLRKEDDVFIVDSPYATLPSSRPPSLSLPPTLTSSAAATFPTQ
jgi:hypothetical protein